MTSLIPTDHDDPTAAARIRAAQLFRAAADDDGLGFAARLRCLAAITALDVVAPVSADTEDIDAETRIKTALAVLGALDLDHFDDQRVQTAARHGRQALLERH